MENLRNEIQSFMQEMVENNLDTLKEQNAEYARCKEDVKNNLKAMDELMEKLCAEDKELMNKYEMNAFTISAIEQIFLYKQGWHDCIDFLKLFGIL